MSNSAVAESARLRSEFSDVALAPATKITLADYVRRIKNLDLDVWQEDLCDRLERVFWIARANQFTFDQDKKRIIAPNGFVLNKKDFDRDHDKGSRLCIAAPPQFGKSCIVSQAYPAWLLSYDPLHRFKLATYNTFHSARFSVVIKNILHSPEHKAIFPDPVGHIPERCKAVEWSTYARMKLNDGQASFTALGLETGFTGTGAETLVIDDPYASVEKALSELTRDKTWRFRTDTALPRLTEQSNEIIMFHRYHQDDMGGRAIATGTFSLLRYAAEADGDYEDEGTGLVFPDPLGRKEGEVLSLRRSPAYYETQKKNEAVWFSQFQGRPSSKTGAMFDVTMFQEIEARDVPELLYTVRAWDNAATEGGGAYSVGDKRGIDSSGNIYVLDIERKQVNTAGREALQLATAMKDRRLVAVHAPQDPGSAGKDIAYKFRQMLRNYQVFTEPVTGTKEARAYQYSVDVNKGKVFLVKNLDGSTPEWFKPFKEEHRYFPVSTYKDQVDAGSDGYKYLTDLYYRGLVIKGYKPAINLVPQEMFIKRFGGKIPEKWDVSAAVRISPDASKPSGWAIIVRPSEDAYLGEVVFLLASVKYYTYDPTEVLTGLSATLIRYFDKKKQSPTVWLSRDSASVVSVAGEKLDMHLRVFDHDAGVGVPEANWYFQSQDNTPHHFYSRMGASRAYILVPEAQIEEPTSDAGQIAVRQELTSWSYNEREEPQPFGGIILDCVRMMLYNFSLTAVALTTAQRQESKLPDELKLNQVLAKRGTSEFVETVAAREMAQAQIRVKEAREKKERDAKTAKFRPRFAQHKRWRSKK